MSFCSARNVEILQELRFVAQETGLREARRMPREVRQWWIGEMQRDRQGDAAEVERIRTGKRRVDV